MNSLSEYTFLRGTEQNAIKEMGATVNHHGLVIGVPASAGETGQSENSNSKTNPSSHDILFRKQPHSFPVSGSNAGAFSSSASLFSLARSVPISFCTSPSSRCSSFT